MAKKINLKYQLASAWSGFALLVLYALSWGLIGHGAPPVSPNLNVGDLAAYYQQYNERILIGMTLAAVAGGLWISWTGQLTIVMLRIEISPPILTIIQFTGGILTAWILVSCPVFWA